MDPTEIDQLTTDLESIFPPAAVSDFAKPNRSLLYKNAGRAIDQERRWRQKLDFLRRKSNKAKQFDENRDLSFSSDTVITPATPSVLSKPEGYRGKSWRWFSVQLMLSEWFLFLPPTIETEYLMKICPKGRHVLVSAQKGRTKVFSRVGKLLRSTFSCLPGGGLCQSERQNQSYCTMLDCILLSETDDLTPFGSVSSTESSVLSLYVIDLLRFRNTDYTIIPFRERCSWLENFLREDVEQAQEENSLHFTILPAYSCDLQTMCSVFSKEPDFSVDGILFYHELVRYEAGSTPLVTWLKPYMLKDWFPNLDVHPKYLEDMPADYTTYLDEVRAQEEKVKEMRSARQQS